MLDGDGLTSDKSAWPQLALHIKSHDADTLEEALFASGALSVMFQDRYDQPILEPEPGEVRLWNDVRVIALYPQKQQSEPALALLGQLLQGDIPPYEWLSLPNQQWERSWMAQFKPMQFSDHLWICPTHCEPPDPSAANVRLDPGLAFGSGTHATTRQCLEWLGNHRVAGLSVVDYGCGSGVLAIAAAMLGAASVIAVDTDNQALTATRNNAMFNNVSDRLHIGVPDIVSGCEVDLLLANILYKPLWDLAPLFASLVRPGGHLLLSGILYEQIEPIQLRYNQWFSVKETGRSEDWAVIHATRDTTRQDIATEHS